MKWWSSNIAVILATLARRLSYALRITPLLASVAVLLSTCWLWPWSHIWASRDVASPILYVESPSHNWIKGQIYPGVIQLAWGKHDRSVLIGWNLRYRPAGGERTKVHKPWIASVGDGNVVLNDVFSGSSFLYPATLIRIRFWPITLASLLVPAAYAFRLLRRRPRCGAGLCPRCGYDLRAHNPGQKCPECGTPILPTSATRSSPLT